MARYKQPTKKTTGKIAVWKFIEGKGNFKILIDAPAGTDASVSSDSGREEQTK